MFRLRVQREYINIKISISVYMTFVTEKGICTSSGEIRYEIGSDLMILCKNRLKIQEKHCFWLQILRKIVKLLST